MSTETNNQGEPIDVPFTVKEEPTGEQEPKASPEELLYIIQVFSAAMQIVEGQILGTDISTGHRNTVVWHSRMVLAHDTLHTLWEVARKQLNTQHPDLAKRMSDPATATMVGPRGEVLIP